MKNLIIALGVISANSLFSQAKVEQDFSTGNTQKISYVNGKYEGAVNSAGKNTDSALQE
jgi:hypothetical protein